MKLFQNWQNIPDEIRDGIYAIGNFDGMHQAHQALLIKTLALAKEQGKPSGIITFEPITKVYFADKDSYNLQLMMAHNKAETAKAMGFDHYFQLTFDSYLAHHSGKKFIEDVLVNGIRIHHLVSGYDFVFGHKRSGNAGLLTQYADQFDYTQIEKQSIGDKKIGSSVVRDAIEAGDIQTAKALMGHDWVVDLQVKKGQLFFRCYMRPQIGEYDVKVIIDNKIISDQLVVKKKNAVLKSTKLKNSSGLVRVVF